MGRSIPPGQTEEIKVSLATKGRVGEYMRQIPVQTNDAKARNLMLTCKGRAMMPIKTEQPMVNFGSVPRDAEAQTRTITITRGDGGPLALELLPAANPQMAAALREIDPGEKYELQVTVNPPWPNTIFRADVTFKTGLPDAPTEVIPVMAQIQPRLQANPPRFTVTRGAPSEAEVKVQLVWSGKNPGHVLEATSSDPTLSVRVAEENAAPVLVLTAPAQYEQKTGIVPFVTVKTDDQTVPNLRIPVLLMPTRMPTARPPGVAPNVGAAPGAQGMLDPAGLPGAPVAPGASGPRGIGPTPNRVPPATRPAR